MGLPFAIRSAATGLRPRAIGASTTHTVPGGKFLYVFELSSSATGSFQVTPSGGAAITINAAGASAYLANVQVGLCLGAGDALTTPASAAALGIEVDSTQLVGSPTRVLQVVDNTTSYTPAASKLLVVTHLLPGTAATAMTATIDGVAGRISLAHGAIGSTSDMPALQRAFLVTAGIAIATLSADDWLLSGLLFSI